jgi:tetratricopeptide (TPR) repeat protein
MKITLLKKVTLFVLLTVGYTATAQDDKVKEVAGLACDCVSKIQATGLSTEKVIEEINSCIRTNSLMTKLKAVNEQSEKDKQSGDTTKKEYNITMGDDFKEVQTYLNKNCDAVKTLMAANKEVVALSKNKKAVKFYEEGLQYTKEKQYNLAVVSYSKAVKYDPEFVIAWNYLGLNYRRLNNYTEAIKCYKKSLELDPTGLMPLQNMAIAYQYLEDFKNAAATYEKFIALHKDDPEGYFGAASAFYSAGEFEKGVDYIFKAYKLYAEAESPYVNDAKQILFQYNTELKAQGKEEVFRQAAKNNDIELK